MLTAQCWRGALQRRAIPTRQRRGRAPTLLLDVGAPTLRRDDVAMSPSRRASDEDGPDSAMTRREVAATSGRGYWPPPMRDAHRTGVGRSGGIAHPYRPRSAVFVQPLQQRSEVEYADAAASRTAIAVQPCCSLRFFTEDPLALRSTRSPRSRVWSFLWEFDTEFAHRAVIPP